MRRALLVATVSVALGVTGAPSAAAAAEPLPTLRIDPSMTTLSGLSSGGYMAVQLHVAYSATFGRGVGVVAAGPWRCAQGTLRHATGRCLTHEGGTPVAELQAEARRLEAAGAIDPLSNLQASRVYLFAGARDTAVRPPLVADLARWYAPFVPAAQVMQRTDVPAEHGMVTDDFGNACDARGGVYIQDCDVDVAGELLGHLVGPGAPLAPRNDGALAGRFVAIDQREFIGVGRGMGEEARLFVPRECEAGAKTTCRLHVVLHGCGQNLANVGEAYVRQTGYPRWADTNRLVLLFPQTSREALNACWDWWGYTGADYATKRGVQMAAIKAMVDRLSGAATNCVRGFNGWHAMGGRAVASWFGDIVARGSGVSLGRFWQRSALVETVPGHWVRAGAEAC